jgi:hypothetical protein
MFAGTCPNCGRHLPPTGQDLQILVVRQFSVWKPWTLYGFTLNLQTPSRWPPIVGLCVALGGPALLAGPAGSILGNPARLTSHIIDQPKSRLRIASIVVTCANDT